MQHKIKVTAQICSQIISVASPLTQDKDQYAKR